MQTFEAAPLEDGELDLRAYLGVLRRRWKAITLITIVAVAAALGLSLRQDPQYRSSSELLIRQDDSSVLSGAPSASGNDAARQLNNEVRLFESSAVEVAVGAAYDGPLDPGDVVASVQSESSDVVEASLTAGDPDDAARLVDLYVATFIEVRRTQRTDELLSVGTEIQAKIDELTVQIGAVRQPLTDLDAQVAADPSNEDLAARRSDLAAQLDSQLSPLESKRAFYQNQIDDLELTAGIAQSGGAQVLTAAEVPTEPISPKPARDLALALALGLVAGIGIALLVDTLDERIRTVGDLEQVTGGLPTLALIPEVDKHDAGFISLRDEPRGSQAEAFRSLRTAVKFAALDHPLRVIQVTSPSSGEGKTTTVANLAVALAQGGDRVAIVCCDLRRPRVQDRFGVSLTPGLTDVLLGDAPLADALRRYDHNILILPAGTPPPNPSELLSTNKATAVIRALSEEFDIVLIDSTPVLPVTDALVVSRLADATLVVADSRSTALKAVRRSLQLLGQVSAPVLGVVLNGVPEGSQGYGYGYMYVEEPSRKRRKRSTKESGERTRAGR